MKINNYFLIVLFVLLSCQAGYSQVAGSNKEIIFRAMQDELNRSLDKLDHPEAGKPFFISFYYSMGSYLSSKATLGALISSSSTPLASTSYRLMMGSYDFNDENFEEEIDYEPVYHRNTSPPLDADYMGIRRVFWNMANDSYRTASKNYLAKKAYFTKNPWLKPAFPDYLKQEAVSINIEDAVLLPTASQADSLTRVLSYIFSKYDKISTSSVSFSMINSNIYVLNSEGSRIKIPVNISDVQISATVMNSNSESFTEAISFVTLNPMELIKNQALSQRIEKFAQYMLLLADAPKLDDIYNGPVLYTGITSAPKIMSMLFAGKEALIAERESISNTPDYRRSETKSNSFESKIGKRVMPQQFSVVLKPGLENYKGVALFGKTLVDFDATVPPDELILVENGVLRDLLRNRIPSSKNVTSSNGHYRMTVTESDIMASIEPSNLFFTSSATVPASELKSKLISLAREEGLDFAIIVRPVDEATNSTSEAFYRVSLEDGSETLIQPLIITSEGGKMINQVAGCSDREIVFNFLSNSTGGYYEDYDLSYSITGSGIPCSIIMPDAMLLTGMEAESLDASVDKWLLEEVDEAGEFNQELPD